MNKTKKGIVAFLLAAALLVSMVGMVSAQSQTWYLSSTGGPGENGKVMYKGSQDGGTANVKFEESTQRDFNANASAACDLTFTAGTWEGQLERIYEAGSKEGKDYRAEIGVLVGGTFTPITGVDDAFTGTDTIDTFSIAADAIDISTGQYLALRIKNRHPMGEDPNDMYIVTVNSNSWVMHPLDDPDYPVPELPTIILMSTGLLALFGYVAYSRSRRMGNNK